MQQRDTACLGPALTQLGNDCLERRDDLLVVRLVCEVTDTITNLTLLVDRVVPHRATEKNNCAATGL